MNLPDRFTFVHRRDGPKYTATAEFVNTKPGDWIAGHGFLFSVTKEGDDKPSMFLRESAIIQFIESEAWEVV